VFALSGKEPVVDHAEEAPDVTVKGITFMELLECIGWCAVWAFLISVDLTYLWWLILSPIYTHRLPSRSELTTPFARMITCLAPSAPRGMMMRHCVIIAVVAALLPLVWRLGEHFNITNMIDELLTGVWRAGVIEGVQFKVINMINILNIISIISMIDEVATEAWRGALPCLTGASTALLLLLLLLLLLIMINSRDWFIAVLAGRVALVRWNPFAIHSIALNAGREARVRRSARRSRLYASVLMESDGPLMPSDLIHPWLRVISLEMMMESYPSFLVALFIVTYSPIFSMAFVGASLYSSGWISRKLHSLLSGEICLIEGDIRPCRLLQPGC
jgi:hypothetical protein